MAINENIGPDFEENKQQQPPATPTRRTLSQVSVTARATVLTPFNVLQRQNQQEETNSHSDFTLSSSNGGNQNPSHSSSNRGSHTNKDRGTVGITVKIEEEDFV